MTSYAMLLRASANRVYGQAAVALGVAELSALSRGLLGGAISDPAPQTIAGVGYLVFESAGPLDELVISVVSLHSGAHALFEVCGDLLRPVPLTPRALVDDDITTIQRYVGKTNEQFTRLLLNVTLAASHGGFGRMGQGRPVSVLDPLCGRGTTLNQAVVYGLDAWGVERDGKDFDAYVQFIGRWLKDQRLKHTQTAARLRRGRDEPARSVSIRYGRDRSVLDRRIEVFHDDTLNAATHIKARSIDLIVGDLPYGVQHRTQAGGRAGRRPADLLVDALPGWTDLMVPGGAIGLAWNLLTLRRAEMFSLLESAGLHPVHDIDDTNFVHSVDRAISRDLVVAVKPTA
jgi:hypothetical protein